VKWLGNPEEFSCPVQTLPNGGLPSGGGYVRYTEYEVGASTIGEAAHCMLGSWWKEQNDFEPRHLLEELQIIENAIEEYGGEHVWGNYHQTNWDTYDLQTQIDSVNDIRKNSPKLLRRAQRLRDRVNLPYPLQQKVAVETYSLVENLAKAMMQSVGEFPGPIRNAFQNFSLAAAVIRLRKAVNDYMEEFHPEIDFDKTPVRNPSPDETISEAIELIKAGVVDPQTLEGFEEIVNNYPGLIRLVPGLPCHWNDIEFGLFAFENDPDYILFKLNEGMFYALNTNDSYGIGGENPAIRLYDIVVNKKNRSNPSPDETISEAIELIKAGIAPSLSLDDINTLLSVINEQRQILQPNRFPDGKVAYLDSRSVPTWRPDDAERIGARISYQGSTWGYYFDANWKDNFDPEDEEIGNIRREVDPAFLSALDEAFDQGYNAVIFWF
jgi:hypothetical protein